MPIKEYCVYNETRESLLSSRVSIVDTKSDPLNMLKALMEGPAPNAEAGLWLNPLKIVPTVPRLSAYDLVYLDQDCRVIQGVELAPDAEVPSFNGHAASALVLPLHSFASSQTHPGDKVIMRASAAGEELPAPVPALMSPAAAPQGRALLAEHSSANVGISQPLWGASFGQPEAIVQRLECNPKVHSPGRKSDSSKFRPWRALARLRVHISISIDTFPVAKASPSQTGKEFAQWGSLRTRFTGWSAEFLHQCTPGSIAATAASVAKWTRSRPRRRGPIKIRCTGWPGEFLHQSRRLLVTTIPGLVAKTTRSVARKYASWKIGYEHWARVFVYGPERVAAGTAFPGAQRAEVRARDEDC
jgi:hypothetical protein